MSQRDLKKVVGEDAAKLVEDGMVVGLGTGSTVYYTIKAVGERVKSGLKIQAVPTSEDTSKKMKEFGIPEAKLNEIEKIDIAIDGADEVSKDLDLIKGGGGALTREKIVDYLAEKFIVVIDEGKYTQVLGDFAVPVEIMEFCWKSIGSALEKLGAQVTLRGGDSPFVTDNKNYILDAKFQSVLKPATLEQVINNIPGVVENGLFRAEKVFEVWVGKETGVEVLKKE